MRTLSPEVVEQLQEQLDRAAAGTPAQLSPEAGPPVSPASVRDAIVETTFLVAAVDGSVSPLELVQFADAVEKVFGEGSDVDTEALVKRMAEQLEREGWARRLAAVQRTLSGTEHGEMAYRLAVAVAFVDDVIEHSEAAALDAIARSFGVGDDRANAIMAEVRADLFGD